jgi:hypothetical protein
VNLKRLFHALVLSGSALGAANCGGGSATEPAANAGTGTTGSTTLLPDGGTSTAPGMPGGGAPGW